MIASATTEYPDFVFNGINWKCMKSFLSFSTSELLEPLTHHTCMDQFLCGYLKFREMDSLLKQE